MHTYSSPIEAASHSSLLNVIFEDDYLVAVYKPEGLLVHKSAIDKHETHFLLQQLRDQIGAYVYPIHRLDKPTSGIVLMAKTPDVVAAIKMQMEANIAIKEYLLVCRGYSPEAGCVDHALKPINDFKRKQGKPFDRPAQDAITAFERLATLELPIAIDKYPCSRFSLVRACLLTGRKHQLRRHFKHLSHPIIGCPRYGKSAYNHYFAEHLGVARLLLHASRLQILHPKTGKPLLLLAPPQGVFAGLLQQFEWSAAVAELFCHPLALPLAPVHGV